MTASGLCRILGTLILVIPQFLLAQEVHRCKDSDGSITFSDAPCESDTGDVDTIDATPHQGHQAALPSRVDPVARPERSASREGTAVIPDPQPTQSQSLSKREESSLHRERKLALATLRKRHLSRSEEQSSLEKLQDLDARLGITESDIRSLPPYDRRVYEAYSVHSSSTPKTSDTRSSDSDAFHENHIASQPAHEPSRDIQDVEEGEVFLDTGANTYFGTRSGDTWIREGAQLRNLRTNEQRNVIDD